MSRPPRSITVPIVFASIAVALSIALLVGWTLIIVQNTSLTEEVAQNVWLLVLGIVSFVFIMAVLVVFSVFLASEIQEVRRQDSFIDSVTHELKSPLASIKLCLETLVREGVSDEQQDQLRMMMLDDVSRLSSFIDDVLQASRFSYLRTGMTLSEVHVEELFEECIATVTDRHQVSPTCIAMEVTPALRVCTDRVALEVVVRNLLDNAVKYSGEEPRIQISATLEGKRLVIEVQDHGIGIARSHIKRIFHRFFRAPDANVHTRHGTGLGLFLVAALVRNLGGHVTAYSEGPGKGTKIRVALSDVALDESAKARDSASS